MSIETTYNINRWVAIENLRDKLITVFENDCNERIEYLLYKHRDSEFENYSVVDWTQETEPEGQEWPYWKY